MAGEPTIDTFVRRLTTSFRWTVVLSCVGRRALVVAVLLLIADLGPRSPLFGPAFTTPVLLVALLGALWILAGAWFAWRQAAAPIPLADASFHLKDRLRTYLGLRTQQSTAMGRWLSRDLASDIDRLPARAERHLTRTDLGLLRYLLPVLLLLLLLKMFAPVLPPRHVAQDGPSRSGGTGQDSDSGGGGNRQDEDDPSGQNQQQDSPQSKPPDVEPPPEPEEESKSPAKDPEPEAEAAEDPARPLLDVPVQDEFVVPEFIGDGASRKELANVAVREDGEGNKPPLPGPAARPPERPPTFDLLEFERRLEQALRARTVPPTERLFVARYFELLRGIAASPPADDRR